MSRRLSPLVAFGLAFAMGLVGGCQCSGTNYRDLHYACQTDRDCLDDFRCIEGFCDLSDGGGAGGGSGRLDAGCAGLPETCGNDIDENCNGVLDDGCPCTGASQPCYRDGLGASSLQYPWDGGAGCSAGVQACVNGTLAASCEDEHVPQLEFCDGRDTDCDGLPDPVTCPCQSGRSCYQGPPDTVNANTDGKSICQPGVWNCALAPAAQCVGQVLPAAREVCNGLDDDCNGLVDDEADTQPCGPGVCSGVFRACVDGGQPACDLSTSPPPGYSAVEACGDGIDNNCNMLVEENCSCALDAGITCWTGTATACPTDGGPCKGICQRGQQTCQVQTDGGTGYSACLGSVQPGIENCSNGLDDDCDGLTDCADPSCSLRSCNTTGKICSAGTCQCVVSGGTVQTVETICTDGKDNDCDGLIDCAESACSGQSCGSFGRVCVGTACTCTVSGGTVQTAETLCSDGLDNDCDGLIDCAESACAGQTCAAGKTCTAGLCGGASDGGVVQTTETICNDGFDNDSDLLTDCADSNCSGRTCASNGFVCSSQACVCGGGGGTTQTTESNCFDGFDNDCDGTIDCADPSCLGDGGVCVAETNCSDGIDNDQDGKIDCADTDCIHKKCSSGSAASVCCGPWPAQANTATCINIGTDPNNCGGCGKVCPSGTCSPVTGGGASSGHCTCAAGGPNCPTNQSCSTNVCDCNDSNSGCNSSQGDNCRVVSGPDFCYYGPGD